MMFISKISGFSLGIAVFAFSVGSILWPRTTVADLGELNQVKELPADVVNVLAWPEAKSINIPILLYHYVEYVTDKRDTIRQSLSITPLTFTKQIESLKKAGFTFISTTDLALGLSGVVNLPNKPIILSFDDGYRDFYTDVFPILKKENVKAVVYMVPNFLDRPNYMYTSQVKEIVSSGLIEIGAHTMNHIWLKGINAKTAEYEIRESRKLLQQLTNQAIISFAYPYGAFDKDTAALVEKAGFLNALSTVPGTVQSPDNQYFLFRLRPESRVGDSLINYISQAKFTSSF